MWNKLQPREKRILKLLFLTAAVIVGFMLIEPLVKDFQHTRAERLELGKKPSQSAFRCSSRPRMARNRVFCSATN
ncbi:MAG: hypothetical protein ACYSOF_08360 [Planctomycetota bacterium]|jgi:type II secretory pathway component PulM